MTKTNIDQEREQQVIIATRGISGSGKTTWAKAWVAKNTHLRVRINRDDLRKMVYDSYWFGGDPVMEKMITKMQHAAVNAALRAGKSVVVDDTNLREDTLDAFLKIAQGFSGRVQFRLQDFAVSLQTAISRDDARISKGERGVGKDVIIGQSNRQMGGGTELPRLNARFYEKIVGDVDIPKYEEDVDLPPAWLVDIDGTLARMTGRSPYDFARVGEDNPVQHVVELVKTLKKSGNAIIVMSGRDDSCEALTREWLENHDIPFNKLIMRKTGDKRGDNIMKSELFESNIRGNFYVKGVLDDRDQVVKMWRSKGLFCAQVEYGDF